VAGRWIAIVLSVFSPSQGLPWRCSAQGGEYIDASTASVIAAKHACGSSALLVPMLLARSAGAALAKSR